MKIKVAAVGAGMILLSGCALPVPVQIASWALDGLSYLATEKSVTDHGISVLAQKDCAVLRGLVDSGEFCRDFDDEATALAEGGSYNKVLFGDDSEVSEEFEDADIAAIAAFETAAGGEAPDAAEGFFEEVFETSDSFDALAAVEPSDFDTDWTEDLADVSLDVIDATEIAEIIDTPDKAGAVTNARPIIDDGIATAAETIDLSFIFEVAEKAAKTAKTDGADLNDYPLQVVASVGAPQGTEMAVDKAPEVAEVKAEKSLELGWRAKATRSAKAGNEPTAGIYFVIGSFRDYVNARKHRRKYRLLTPSVLSAKLGPSKVYRVVVGPFGQDQTKGIHKQIYQAGISDSWAIRVIPGEWSMAMIDPPFMAPVEVAVLGQPADEFEWNVLSYLHAPSRQVY